MISYLVLCAPGVVACSFFSPSLDDYAAGRGGAGGTLLTPNQPDDHADEALAGADSGAAGAADGGAGGSIADDPIAVGGEAAVVAEVAKAVRGDDTELTPVITSGLPTIIALTSYGVDESSAAQTNPPRALPTYEPYDSLTDGWWDNLVAEQLQARLPVVMLPSHGAYGLAPDDLSGPDGMNPRNLSMWLGALQRAYATKLFKAVCFLEPASLRAVANVLHKQPAGMPMDLSVTADWDDVFWLRGIKPWFDTIPEPQWFRVDDRPLIQLGRLPQDVFINPAGHLSDLLSRVEEDFVLEYGEYPSFIVDPSWLIIEPAIEEKYEIIAPNALISPPSDAFEYRTGFWYRPTSTLVPGMVDPSYYDAKSSGYQQESLVIPRHFSVEGVATSTLEHGFSELLQNVPEPEFIVLQDFTDLRQASGFYRSSSKDWATPNEYINLIRQFSDLPTVTLRLEAEGCDNYSDTTKGNSSAAYLRSGDLDVKQLGPPYDVAGWAVTNTAPGEWLEFDNVHFSAGNYDFAAHYSTTGAANVKKRVKLTVDDHVFPPLILSNNDLPGAFSSALLGHGFMSHGPHTLRIQFLDGLIDLDWIFVKKTDPVFNLSSAVDGNLLYAPHGGNSFVYAWETEASEFTRFTFDDLNGGELEDGDQVNIQSYNGLYWSVFSTSGEVLPIQRRPDIAEAFTVHALTDGEVTTRSKIALSTFEQRYLTINEDTGALEGTGESIGTAETFLLDRKLFTPAPPGAGGY